MNKLILPIFLIFAISSSSGSDYSITGHVSVSSVQCHIATATYNIEGRIDRPDKCEVVSANYILEGIVVAENIVVSEDIQHVDNLFKEGIELPLTYFLFQNYPNPFNASTIIKYGLREPSQVTVEIYDVIGRKVETLFDGSQPAGYHSIIWNSGDNPSGIYFYKIWAGEFTDTKKMILLK